MIDVAIVIIYGLYIGFILFLSILLHETGHALTMFIYGCRHLEFRKVGKIGIGVTSRDLVNLDHRKKRIIALNGVLAGFIPIIMFSSGFTFLILVFMYIAGTGKDIAKIVSKEV